MLEVKDPAIKLFGKTIQLLPNDGVSAATHDQNLLSSNTSSSSSHDKNCNVVAESRGDNKKPSESELTKTKQGDGSSHPAAEELIDPETSCDNPKKPSVDKEILLKNEEQCESQEKTLKKPDKILPCPRCSSMDTKFCYYNNYNLNQPRHFCKNCQRYWTAGGTMRNVPVGSGRRKNKSSSPSHYRHIMVSEALQAAQADAANGIHYPTLKTNGTVLTFGSDPPPLCKSMASALNLAEKSQSCVRNGFHRPEQRIYVSCGGKENGDDQSCVSSITASNSAEKGGNVCLQESAMKNFRGFSPQVPYFPAPPWPSPWNSAQWRSPMPPPAFGPPASFYTAPPYWGYTLPGSWNMPWIAPPPSSPDHSAMSSNPNSPTLGKHSRDGDMLKLSNLEKEKPLKENNSRSGVLIPKILRIDDPSEAAKSSILSTLGIKNEQTDPMNRGSLFKAFQSKGDEKNHIADTSPVLQANPAALSRSLNFQEST
ncbi:hypothetical protein F0562_033786 [Nyssa sinensis]|uniref:Dof-type domain-containing protein n=1 Tax=Nyssa sinensis TaxID=561372 RepID=A0A5J5AEF3_9ASTE|nr:hypothetical protein F0562_033786 [Nyssa sinensis]